MEKENEQVEMTEKKDPLSMTELLVVVMVTGFFLEIGATLAFETVNTLKSCIEKTYELTK